MSNSSDLDLSIIIESIDEKEVFIKPSKIREVLEYICEYLLHIKLKIANKELDRFKIYLEETSFGLLMKITDMKYDNLEIELSVNKTLDAYNSALIRTYALIDSRFHKLALILKDWNKASFKDKKTRMNSYSIVLMLIAYLQYEKILPKL